MKKLILILIILSNCCLGQDIPLPQDYEIIGEAEGDLDRDGIAEKAVVVNTTDSSENGLLRELRIFKFANSKWTLWKRSTDAVLASDEGGMMGDPFGEVNIKNNVLTIYHSGGSSWKWGTTDKYRFQHNDWELIGYLSEYGKPCEYMASFDFNLSTGKIIYSKEYATCDDDGNETIAKTESETFVQKDILLNMNNRHSKEIKIVTPKYKEEIYL
ncbi:MAG: hypothetical protein JWO58_228 [Chitinophagaceae bacterium]|nr:hypothetical protein [Chitinophagaceae bacterium]